LGYTFRVFHSVDEINLKDWQYVRSACGGSIFLDPSFMTAVEIGMKHSHRFWYVIFYENNEFPVACTSLCATDVDLANFADPGLAWTIRHLPLVSSRLRRLKLLICGLPLMIGQHTLALTVPSTSPQILSLLDEIVRGLASELKIDAIVYKEFRRCELEWTSPLSNLGYLRVPIPPIQLFRPLFRDLEHYCAALRSHYRKQINRSIKKLKQAGVEISILTDPEQILSIYTPEAHGLYNQMLEKAKFKFEALSIDFFRELTFRLGDQINLILFAKDARIISLGWCLHAGSACHMLYAGLDYKLNADLDLYFNLIYAALDYALKKKVLSIEVGMTANSFKAKLGCYSEPLYAFIKGVSPLVALMIRYGGTLLVGQMPEIPASNIFKSSAVHGSN
jgi:Peptidogalycan biosysnthesis/recognition